jgi:hypothetical protein
MFNFACATKPVKSFNLGGNDSVKMSIFEDQGSLTFLMKPAAGISPDAVKGLCMKFSNDSDVEEMTIYPEVDVQEITPMEDDACLPGGESASNYDMALRFGSTAGSCDGEISEVGFTLFANCGKDLSLKDIDLDSIGAVLDCDKGEEWICGRGSDEDGDDCDRGDDRGDDHHDRDGHHKGGKHHDGDRDGERHWGKGDWNKSCDRDEEEEEIVEETCEEDTVEEVIEEPAVEICEIEEPIVEEEMCEEEPVVEEIVIEEPEMEVCPEEDETADLIAALFNTEEEADIPVDEEEEEADMDWEAELAFL